MGITQFLIKEGIASLEQVRDNNNQLQDVHVKARVFEPEDRMLSNVSSGGPSQSFVTRQGGSGKASDRIASP